MNTAERVLTALAGDRVLPASMLAMEAGVSGHTLRPYLRELIDADMVTIIVRGHHHYYRLTRPRPAPLTGGAEGPTISSLRAGTRTNVLRRARSCRGHLAGRLGCALTSAFIDAGFLTGHDGSVDLDRLTGTGTVAGALDPAAYTLTDSGTEMFTDLGASPPHDRTIHGCVDWTEQRHHIAGIAGRLLLERFKHHGWIQPGDVHRALKITTAGQKAFTARFGIDVLHLA